MARTHGRILTAIWRDPEFRQLPASAQHLYIACCTSSHLSYCGVMPYLPNNFARLAADLTAPKIVRTAHTLAANRYLLIDRDTSELLVRSFIRHDELLKQPNMATAMGKAYMIVESLALREAIIHELRRLYAEDPDLAGWRDTNGKGLAATHPELLALVQSEGFGKPFGKPFPEPQREGVA
jgi:hypothetical protein